MLRTEIRESGALKLLHQTLLYQGLFRKFSGHTVGSFLALRREGGDEIRLKETWADFMYHGRHKLRRECPAGLVMPHFPSAL
jgi:hypothetical protein